MRSILSCLTITATLIATLAIQAQQTTQPRQQPPPGSLEADPRFQRLSPDQQAWVTAMTHRLQTAVDHKDISGIEQIQLDLAKRQIIGTNVCSHVVDEGTFVDAISLNPSQDAAIAIRWMDPQGIAIHSAIFTGQKRCVVTDGQTLDGKLILRAMSNSLAVSNQHALTAWEALYWNSLIEPSKGGTPHRGVFIENRFVVELDQHKSSTVGSRDLSDQDRDFRWNTEQETLAVKPGIVLVSATLPPSQPCPAIATKRPSFLDKIRQHAERTLEKEAGKVDAEIGKASGGSIDIGAQDSTTTAVNDAEHPTPCPSTTKK